MNPTNSRNPTNSINPTNAIASFLELCNPACASLSFSPSKEDWDSISNLAQRHGLAAYLLHQVKSLHISLPEGIRIKWIGNFLFQVAREEKARRQIKELKAILDPERVPFILLKGTSAMLRLYPNQGLRAFCDMDILIPPEKASLFKEKMAEAGYKPSVILNSPEEEEVWKFESHLPAINKGGAIPIEAHLSILARPGSGENGLREIWGEKEEAEMDGVKVCHLSPEHYVIHMLLHFEKHLKTEGNLEIKSLIDVLQAVKAWKVDWQKLWSQAARWKVEKVISPVAVTLNYHWQAGIPVAERGAAFDLEELISKEEELQKTAIQRVPAGFLHRLSKAGELPGFVAKMHYLFHIFFPIRENLHWRYGTSGDKSMGAYYFFHFAYIGKRFFSGLGLSFARLFK